MGNLFAFRATDPKNLPNPDRDERLVNPVGEAGRWQGGWRENVNDHHLKRMAEGAGLVVAGSHGAVAMRPLVLREIADTLGLHESTISRVTTQKYILSPHGMF